MLKWTSPGAVQPWMQSRQPCHWHLLWPPEVLSLSCSYMLVLCLGYAVTGEPSDFEGLDFKTFQDAAKLAHAWQLALCRLPVAFHGGPQESSDYLHLRRSALRDWDTQLSAPSSLCCASLSAAWQPAFVASLRQPPWLWFSSGARATASSPGGQRLELGPLPCTGPHTATQVRDMVLCTLAMAFGWCIIHAVRWTNTDLSKALLCLMPRSSHDDMVSSYDKLA